jgi:hypothetical protein
MKAFKSILFTLICFQFIAQKTPGYLGKKFVLEFSTKINTPIFSKQYVTNYANSQFLVKQKFIDLGLLAGGSYALKRNLMLGLTIGYSKFRVDVTDGGKIDKDTNSYTDDIDLLTTIPNPLSIATMPALQAIPFKVFSFVPKIEFAGKGALLPMGLYHTIGIGFMSIKPDKRSVAGYTRIYGGDKVFSSDVQNLIDPNNKSLLVLTIQYALNMRMPINDRMMFNFGVLYTGNVFKDAKRASYSTSPQKENSEYFISRENYINNVRARVQSNFISFTTGISILL